MKKAQVGRKGGKGGKEEGGGGGQICVLFGKLKEAIIGNGKRCWKDGTVVGHKARGSLCLDKDDLCLPRTTQGKHLYTRMITCVASCLCVYHLSWLRLRCVNMCFYPG